MKKIAIFGASGFASETADIADDCGYREILFIEKTPGTRFLGEDSVEMLEREGFDFAIGIGDNEIREKIYKKYNRLNYPNLIHSSVTFGRGQKAALEKTKGNIICAGARFTNSITIGDFNIINLNSCITHNCILENFVNISPGVNISGNVSIGEKALLGSNCTVINGRGAENRLRIGRNAMIGIGTLIMADVADNARIRRLPDM
jgi:sugar O-acyltransferase (sialic acid O-acetyltransferase NeuD family)